MDTQTANAFFGLLALLAFVLAGGGVVALVAATTSGRARRRVLDACAAGWDRMLALGFAIALVATVGSLYSSEVAHFVPCPLCWYQRIAMYPLVVILGIGWWRRDAGAAWYALPLATVGAGVAAYHAVLERYPSLGEGVSCSTTAPCTVPYFRQFGWMTLAVMALAGFLAILALSIAALVGARRDRTMATT